MKEKTVADTFCVRFLCLVCVLGGKDHASSRILACMIFRVCLGLKPHTACNVLGVGRGNPPKLATV